MPAHNRVYPWELWLDGNPHTLKRGVDFREEINVGNMQILVCIHAKRNGLLIKTRMKRSDLLTIRCMGKRGESDNVLDEVNTTRRKKA